MQYEYHVEPVFFSFPDNLSVDEREKSSAEHLEKAINYFAQQGLEFHRLETIQVAVSPGCLAAIFGVKVRYETNHLMVFRRPGSR